MSQRQHHQQRWLRQPLRTSAAYPMKACSSAARRPSRHHAPTLQCNLLSFADRQEAGQIQSLNRPRTKGDPRLLGVLGRPVRRIVAPKAGRAIALRQLSARPCSKHAFRRALSTEQVPWVARAVNVVLLARAVKSPGPHKNPKHKHTHSHQATRTAYLIAHAARLCAATSRLAHYTPPHSPSVATQTVESAPR